MEKRVVVCEDCGSEKLYYAKGLCRNCYMRRYRGPLIICMDCGEEHEHKAGRLCRLCYNRRWVAEHKEKTERCQRQWRENNKKSIKLYRRRYYKEHREEAMIYNIQWNRANPGKYKAGKIRCQARREARKHGVANTLTLEQLEYEMNIGRAMYPGEKLHVHHVVPLSQGGGHTWGNIMVIPASLNFSIRDRLPQEVYRQLCFM